MGLYYTLNEGDDLDCKPGKGLVDLSGGSAYYSIRVKATEPMQIKMYLQEGNDASWDLSKVSATPLVMDLTTSYQHFCVHEVDSNPLVGNVALDLSKIGTLVFELGKTDGVNFDQVDGKVFIDYIRIKAYDCGNSIKEVEQKVVNHNLYPNPSNGKFNVELLNYEKSTISLLNVNGKLIESKTSLGKEIVEFKNDLTKGLYFVQVQTKSGIQVSKLTVK